jgi:hypothetical protein
MDSSQLKLVEFESIEFNWNPLTQIEWVQLLKSIQLCNWIWIQLQCIESNSTKFNYWNQLNDYIALNWINWIWFKIQFHSIWWTLIKLDSFEFGSRSKLNFIKFIHYMFFYLCHSYLTLPSLTISFFSPIHLHGYEKAN